MNPRETERRRYRLATSAEYISYIWSSEDALVGRTTRRQWTGDLLRSNCLEPPLLCHSCCCSFANILIPGRAAAMQSELESREQLMHYRQVQVSRRFGPLRWFATVADADAQPVINFFHGCSTNFGLFALVVCILIQRKNAPTVKKINHGKKIEYISFAF